MRLFFSIFLIHAMFLVHAQNTTINEGIYFQAVAKDNAGHPAISKHIYVQTGILQTNKNGALIFGDLHQVKTDDQGVFGIMIGQGEVNQGLYASLKSIAWSEGALYLNLKVSIQPDPLDIHWEYSKNWIDIGTSPFGAVPYAMSVIGSSNSGIDIPYLNRELIKKLSVSDTATMLKSYLRVNDYRPFNGVISYNDLTNKPILFDGNYHSLLNKPTIFSGNYNELTNRPILFDGNYNNLSNKPSFFLGDYADLFNKPILFSGQYNDLSGLPDLSLKENIANKSNDISIDANSTIKYPSVNAVKTYVDATVLSGAPDADAYTKGILKLSGDLTGNALSPLISNNAITTNKILDASVTNDKIAFGIQASKIGLEHVTNHSQLYNLNGLTAQVQSFATPGLAGLNPNWLSIGSTHILNIPMANASSVTAGLISKSDYDHFNSTYVNSFNALTTSGNSGAASLTGQSLNIPNYTLAGLSGSINPNYFLAGPSSGTAGAVQYRALVAADIPNNASNTSGNASTATSLATTRTINSVAFDGTDNITIKASTTNRLFFSTGGLGAAANENFDGSTSKTISYNTIGAAPYNGSLNITTLGTIATGIWNGSVIGQTVGGAGTVNGILKADGDGLVSAASTSDYQVPLTFSSPLTNVSSNISISQSNSNTAGFLSSADWNTFNNKISPSDKGVANGVASLNASGKIPTSQIPAISFSSGYVVNNQTEMLALYAAVVGSIAIRTDNSKNYVLSALDPTVLSNWLELLMPAAVSSVNGYTTGSIVLTSSDINEGTNLYFTNTRVKTALNGFLTTDAPLTYNTSTTKLSITQAGNSSHGYLSSTDWNTFNNKMNTFGVQLANTIYAAPNGINGSPSFRTLVAADIPILNQNTTGNAATSTILETSRSINGVGFNGSVDITVAANTNNAITFNSSGTGAASSASFNGSSAKTISYNTIGASPIVGTTSLTTLGTITTGTWNASVIGSIYGGAGTNNGILKANGSGTVSEAIIGTDYEAPLSFTTPLNRTSNTISIQAATSNSNGYLTSTDWSTFNNKQAVMTAGTGVNISGGNTINIGQEVASSSSPSFTGLTLSGLNIAGIVTNSANGVLSTTTSTGTGNIVRSISPTLVSPALGDATANSINVSTDITAKRYKLTMPTTITAEATTTIDLSTGNVFTVSMGVNVTTFSLTNPALGTYLIKFVQNATGSKEVTFPATWKWAGSVAPSLTNTANKTDIVTLIYDGATFYATIVQNF